MQISISINFLYPLGLFIFVPRTLVSAKILGTCYSRRIYDTVQFVAPFLVRGKRLMVGHPLTWVANFVSRACCDDKCSPALQCRHVLVSLMLFFSRLIRREYGLERFVPTSLVEAMKRKELRKLLSHFFKINQQLTAPGQKQLTALQAKLHYLKIISELPSYGAKCFSTNFKVINETT